jgi:hypothetical protein
MINLQDKKLSLYPTQVPHDQNLQSLISEAKLERPPEVFTGMASS